MFNLTVDTAHTFYVGENGWLVHNTGPCELFVQGESRLVGANRAVIDPRKLTEYSLNPAHPVGGNKAKVFESALGFNQSNASELAQQIRQGLLENSPALGLVDKYGTRFAVDMPITGPAGSAVVRTAWIFRVGKSTPELISTYVLPK